MFQKILVASDLTEASRAALAKALAMGEKLGIPVVALHVAEVPEQAAAKRVLEDQIRELDGELDGRLGASVLVQAGHPAEGITEVAASIGADLIVVGTHGRTGLQHMLLGSVAERVVRTAPCTVMTVRGTLS